MDRHREGTGDGIAVNIGGAVAHSGSTQCKGIPRLVIRGQCRHSTVVDGSRCVPDMSCRTKARTAVQVDVGRHADQLGRFLIFHRYRERARSFISCEVGRDVSHDGFPHRECISRKMVTHQSREAIVVSGCRLDPTGYRLAFSWICTEEHVHRHVKNLRRFLIRHDDAGTTN